MSADALAQYECVTAGCFRKYETFDVWGTVTINGTFVPANVDAVCCPDCGKPGKFLEFK